MNRLIFVLSVLVSMVSAPAFGALQLTKYDTWFPRTYPNGGGTGFGGTLGNGTISMDRVGTNLVIGFAPGNALNDIVGLLLDTRSGGFLDAQMDDQQDGSRRTVSNLAAGGLDTFPAGVLPDFGVAISQFGAFLFELNAGNTPGHLTFVPTASGPLTITIPLATLGNPYAVDFFAGYVADSGYGSNESLPFSTPLNSGGNLEFNGGGVYENFDRFVTVPEASTVLVWGLVLISAGFARRYFA